MTRHTGSQKNLRKLGGTERLKEALCYNTRDVELTELLLSAASAAEMEKRRVNLAASLKLRHQILMDLFAQTGEEAYRVSALAACEQALELRTANAEANPTEKNLEKLENAKKDLEEIQLTGV